MTSDFSSPPAPQSPDDSARARASRQERRARRLRRQRIRRGVVIGGTSLLVLLVGLILTDTVRLPGAATSRVQAGAGVTVRDEPTPEATRRALTATTPMRLWIAGDSLAYVLGQELGKTTAASGVVKPVYDARVSSGLNSPTFFNWPEHSKKEIARLNPETIVFIIGANDLGVVGGTNWQQSYGARVDEMMKLLSDGDRRVYWVGSPAMRNKQQHAAAKQLDAFMETQAKKFPNVTYIDAFTLFTDTKGAYQDRLPDENGKSVLVRTDDGIHLNAVGGAWLSDAIFELMDREWRISAQDVAGVTQTVEQTAGCCRTPSGSSNTQWQVVVPTTKPSATTTTKPSAASSTTTTKPAASSTTTTKAPTTSSSSPASSTTTTT